MKKAIWFSQHEPTAAQRAEIERAGYKLINVEEGTRLGSYPINNEDDVSFVLSTLRASEPDAVFGVFPVPIQREITICARWANDDVTSVPCFAAWNINLAPEGEPPKFEHKCFAWVGDL